MQLQYADYLFKLYAMKEAKTIDEVLDQLDHIIDETLSKKSYAGLFAYVYRRTTAEIKKAIEQKRFEDNVRMEKMDVIFANFYIAAYNGFKENLPISKSWKTSFEVQMNPLTSIQHVLLGMNAHINLDLGQAAAIVASGSKISSLENDFMEVNKVLAELVDEMQRKLGKISPLMMLLDWIGKRSDELMVNFSMVKARNQAWNLANELSNAQNDQLRKMRVEIADDNIALLGSLIVKPPGRILKFILKIISATEEKNIRKIIERLTTE